MVFVLISNSDLVYDNSSKSIIYVFGNQAWRLQHQRPRDMQHLPCCTTKHFPQKEGGGEVLEWILWQPFQGIKRYWGEIPLYLFFLKKLFILFFRPTTFPEFVEKSVGGECGNTYPHKEGIRYTDKKCQLNLPSEKNVK